MRNFNRIQKILSVLLIGIASFVNVVGVSVKSLAVDTQGVLLRGKASWIGERFQGKKTSSGEQFDMNDLTASHATLSYGTMVKVTSDKTGKSVKVRINNRLEIDSGRIIDLSKRAAEQIGLVEEGVGYVTLRNIERIN